MKRRLLKSLGFLPFVLFLSAVFTFFFMSFFTVLLFGVSYILIVLGFIGVETEGANYFYESLYYVSGGYINEGNVTIYYNDSFFELCAIIIFIILLFCIYFYFLHSDVIEEKDDEIRYKESVIKERDNKISHLTEGIKKKDDFYEGLKNNPDNFIGKIISLHNDFMFLQYDISADYLEIKKHPARKEAQRIRELRDSAKIVEKRNKEMQYKYDYLFSLFPELEKYVESYEYLKKLDKVETIDDFIETYDRVQDYLSKEDYEKLSIDERNQLALDRYVEGRKSNWQIGRDYELFCGLEYEKEGWDVEYFGMEMRFEDLGRDLIAKKKNTTHVVQCKYWAKDKVIRENAVLQLYGTTVIMRINEDYGGELFKRNIVPVFITNIELSETAEKFAEKLGVEVVTKGMVNFPRIKCNKGKNNKGEVTKIYHLPFDQQYDRTKIVKGEGFYAETVKEAVEKGYRRAYRWRGDKNT